MVLLDQLASQGRTVRLAFRAKLASKATKASLVRKESAVRAERLGLVVQEVRTQIRSRCSEPSAD